MKKMELTAENSIGLYIENAKKPSGNQLYFYEILTYLGYHCEVFSSKKLKKIIKKLRILIIYGKMEISNKEQKLFNEFVEMGNSLIIVGQISGLADLSGCEMMKASKFQFPVGGTKHNSVGEGYMMIKNTAMIQLDEDYLPLHGFSCISYQNNDAEIWAEYRTVQNQKTYPIIISKKTGSGITLVFATDIVTTIRHIQEGIYVDKDGIPPDDGMAPIDDGILKCEDGCVLDWNKDRRPVSEKYNIPAFMIPICDIWKNILNRLIEISSDHAKIGMERVQYWPDNAEFIMLISHDTDGNNEKLAKLMLERVNQFGIHTTWCIIPPGYSPKTCKEIRDSGHELAFHFDAQSHKLLDIFSFEILKEQFEEVKSNSKISEFYSNKNHYTRWEGRIEFFLWLEKLGIKIDQTKGPSKCGTMGFPFGSAHPWYPMDRTGRLIDCLELSFQSQDIGAQGPDDIGIDILQAVRKVNGVCHFIFHPAHVKKAHIQDKFTELVNDAKNMNARFMTSQEIGEWFHKRRTFIQSGWKNPESNVKSEKSNEIVIKKRDFVKKDWI